jgi:hypothetical protein
MNDIITLEQNIKDVYEIKLKQLYSNLKVNLSRDRLFPLQNSIDNPHFLHLTLLSVFNTFFHNIYRVD